MSKALIPQLLKKYKLNLSLRNQAQADELATQYHQAVFVTGELTAKTDWSLAVQDVDTVIHLAARVHMMNESSENPAAQYHKANVDATMALAKASYNAGVRRFIFISSIKVLGEFTKAGECFSDTSTPNPLDDYARSKWQAEHELTQFSKKTGMELVILRPPLMYGPGVKANFLKLTNLVKRGIPLPLARVHNGRSMLYVGNFADAICQCIESEKVVGRAFCVTDSEAMSTGELVRSLAKVMARPARLLPVPAWMLTVGATLIGAKGIVNRLMQSLVVDGSGFVVAAEWVPPYSTAQGLKATVEN